MFVWGACGLAAPPRGEDNKGMTDVPYLHQVRADVVGGRGGGEFLQPVR